jgi:Intraflagellar transport protein 43
MLKIIFKWQNKLQIESCSESLKRVAAYKELNSNIVSKQKLLQSLDGVDLRVLTKNLLPESQLHEVSII